MDDLDQQARLMKAMAHPARLKILRSLRDGEACVCHLEAQLGYRQPYISQQIMVLRKAGVLEERREGTFIFYHLADPRIGLILDVLSPGDTSREATESARHTACSCPLCLSTPETRA
jgi:DNA-binding transcriptional ArsR family regulator